MSRFLLLAIVAFVAEGFGPPAAPKCDRSFQQHSVFLFSTPEQRYLFFKTDPRLPIGFDVEQNQAFAERIERVFRSKVGRDQGVEAVVCGRLEPVDLPLSPYGHYLVIRQASFVRTVDMTTMIRNYRRAIGSSER
jgi:hypothetical protein